MPSKFASDANRIANTTRVIRAAADRCYTDIAAKALVDAANMLDKAVKELRERSQYE